MEPAAREIFPNLIGPEDVIVEVGARMGDGTRVLAKLGKQVYAFEPARESFFLLKIFTRVNKNVRGYNIALGSSKGEALLQKDRTFSGVSSINKVTGVRYTQKEKVAVTRLDSVRFEFPPTSLVVDCEGSELPVLKGAERLLPNLRMVFVETHSMNDGSDTTSDVISELGRFFLEVRTQYAGLERWVIASKPKVL